MFALAIISVLALLIFIHELGHFLAARLQGIHANKFAIGFGPILWSYQGEQTEYSLRAIPLGGFVGFPDGEPESGFPKSDPDLLRNRPILDRAIVISAGVIANLVFAYLVFVLQFAWTGMPDIENGVLIPQVAETVVGEPSPAAKAGLQPGDVILEANGQPLVPAENTPEAGNALVQSLQAIISESPSDPVELRIQRGETETLDVTVTPAFDPDSRRALIGVTLSPNSADTTRRLGLFETFSRSAVAFQNMFEQVLSGFILLITNFSQMSGELAGPVKIVDQGAALAQENVLALFPFSALISINLAILNILPLPALDGGQLAFLLAEAVRGKPVPTRVQESVMQTGIFLLLGLGIFLIIRDTTQLSVFQNLMQ